jgi:outer membrane protein, heavy metal efflux system
MKHLTPPKLQRFRFGSLGLATLLAAASIPCAASTARAQAAGPPAAAPAAPAPPPATPAAGTSLSLADAVLRAERRAPEVSLAHHAMREASARRVGAGVVMPVNPRLSVDVRPPITGGTVSDAGYGAVLDFLFEVGGGPGARVREADRHAELARAELELERLRARVGAWTAYLRARIAEERMAQVQGSIVIARRVLDASKQRLDLGASGEIEQALAASDVAQLEAQLADASNQRDLHLMELRDVLDMPAEQPLALTTPLEEPGPPAPVDALITRALGGRPDLQAIRRRVDVLDATDERLSKETFPRVGVYLGVDAAPISPIFGIVGMSVELPFAQRNQGPRARTQAARDGEAGRLELEGRRVVRDVVAARAAYETRRGELKSLRDAALPAAERTLELVEIGWRSGRFDIFRVTNAARDVARVRGLRLDALEAAWLERIAVERAIGGAAPSSIAGLAGTRAGMSTDGSGR